MKSILLAVSVDPPLKKWSLLPPGTGKKWVLVLLSLLGVYLSATAQNCSIQPGFQWLHDSTNCKKIWFVNYSQPIGPDIHFNWKFGDGTSSTDYQPSHEYAQPGTYTVTLVMDSANNCVKEVSQTVLVECDVCNVQADFSYQREPSDPNRIYFNGLFTIPPGWTPQFFWDFGDGNTANFYNPTHTYAGPGTYSVRFKVYLNSSCFKEVTKTVVIGDSCRYVVNFSSAQDSVQVNRYHFTSTVNTNDTGLLYSWSFGDGGISSLPNPSHVYQQPGTYTVCLKVISPSNCFGEVCKSITVTVPPVPPDSCSLQAKFEYLIDSMQRNKVYFLNRTVSNQNAVHYLWKFGDGKISNEINPTHLYEQPGTYEVCLVAETSNGCRSEYCSKVEIRSVLCPVEPRFEWRINEDDPRKVHFKNLTLFPGILAKYLWKFGDGTTSTEKDPIHVYDKPGEYEVCLIVEINNLCRKVTCKKIIIRGPECNVHAKFEWKHDAQNRKKIWFNNNSNPVPHIWQTNWTYGDGTSSHDFNSFHEYANPGKYYVCLKVTSLNGCIDTYCDSVIVRGPDTCENRSAFRFEPAGNNPLEIKFKPEHINTTWKYLWKFGDGKQSTAITPIHKYDKPGVYNVCLTVIQRNGCETTTCKEIRVGPNCDNFELTFDYKRNDNKPNKVHFKAITNQHPLRQKWIIRRDSAIYGFPYLVVLNQNNPTFIFPFTGWYTVCLEGKTATGCVKQYCERIYIERVTFSSVGLAPIAIFPNPARNTARIQLKLETSVKMTVTVLDESGAVKYQLQVGGQAGNNTINLPVDKLAQGQYMVQITYGDVVRWARFQKM